MAEKAGSALQRCPCNSLSNCALHTERSAATFRGLSSRCEDERFDYEIVYKLHGRVRLMGSGVPWLAESDIQVINKAEPPLYRLFAESSGRSGSDRWPSTRGLCFDLETFEADSADVLRPLVENRAAETVENINELAEGLGWDAASRFVRKWFLESNSVVKILEELDRICDVHSE